MGSDRRIADPAAQEVDALLDDRVAQLVAGVEAEVSVEDGWNTVELERITDHEVVVLS